MLLNISHTTTYDYDAPVSYALQQIRLTPRSDTQQTVREWAVDIEGGATELDYLDQYNNQTMLVQAELGKTRIKFTAHGAVETNDTSGVLGEVYGMAPLWHFRQSTPRTAAGPQIRKLGLVVGSSSNHLNDLHALSASILAAVPYGTEGTAVGTTAEEALKLGVGVCQDHTQIFVSAARAAGIPARYVSGYLMMNDRVDQDASHAWAEAHIDGLGWVGFDVSNGISPDERYVRLATGLDSQDASPISGMRLGSANESMIVSLQIQQ